MSEAQLDTPVERATIDRLPVSVLDTWLETVRARRLTIVNKLLSVREAKRAAYLKDVEEKYVKQYDRVKLNLAKLDEQVAKVEVYIRKLRALEVELSDDSPIDEDNEGRHRGAEVASAVGDGVDSSTV